MPIIAVSLVEGRTEEQLATLIAGLTEAASSSLDVPAATVRVLLNEVPPSHWGVGGVSKLQQAKQGNPS